MIQIAHLPNQDTAFYPTPPALADRLLAGIDWDEVTAVLEPSAGKGDLAKRAKAASKARFSRYNPPELDLDCVEIDPALRHILTGEGLRVVHDDFLTFNTHKRYDLILMNPPFSNGDEHLLKALELQKDGGRLRCLLNAETLKNPRTNRRKALAQLLTKYGAQVEYIQNAFSAAQRPTDVEVALVRVDIPQKERDSLLFDELLRAKRQTEAMSQAHGLAVTDYIQAMVDMYSYEVAGTVRLINEYHAMKPYMLQSFRKDACYNDAILTLALGGTGRDREQFAGINAYLGRVRYKYWEGLFSNKQFMSALTSNLRKQYMDMLDSLKDYDFSLYNIKTIQFDMLGKLTVGVEETIMALFDKLSGEHAWYPETAKNIHYYNGWATNKAHRINKKVILPIWGAFSEYRRHPDTFDKSTVYNVMSDIEKALDYLSAGRNAATVGLDAALESAAERLQTKDIQLRYFSITLYKKGTCHITFHDLDLLDKLNIYGSRKKNWLPPNYGKVRYDQMDQEERRVIDEFQGAQKYEKVLAQGAYFLAEPGHELLSLGEGTEA